MTVEKKATSRRTLVKGAAWAAPVVAASATVPAYAASPICTPTPGIGQRANSQYGVYGTGTSNSVKTDQYTVIEESQFVVNGLPNGVYLKKATTVVWFRQKTTSDMNGPGLWPADDQTATITNATCIGGSGCGWSKLVPYQKGQRMKNASGATVTNWSVAYSWTANDVPASAYNYSYFKNSSGCYSSLTKKSGDSTVAGRQATEYRIDWTHVTPTAKDRTDQGYWHQTWFELSDGTILTATSNPYVAMPATVPAGVKALGI